MFSEKFHVVEKYDLSSKEYLGTYENMFWKFTSIYDNIYKPELDQQIIDRFRSLFEYKFNNNSTGFEEESTFFGINYIGGDILGYNMITKMSYNLLRPQSYWEDFVTKNNINEIAGLKYKIDQKISKTDNLTNHLAELSFDNTGKITGISIFDTDYKEINPNTDINLINEFDKLSDRYVNVIKFNTNGTLTCHLYYLPPIISGRVERTSESKNLVVLDKPNIQDFNEEIISDMIEYKLIDNEEADYIKSHLTGERLFSIEYQMNSNEMITKKVLNIVTHDLFQQL